MGSRNISVGSASCSFGEKKKKKKCREDTGDGKRDVRVCISSAAQNRLPSHERLKGTLVIRTKKHRLYQATKRRLNNSGKRSKIRCSSKPSSCFCMSGVMSSQKSDLKKWAAQKVKRKKKKKKETMSRMKKKEETMSRMKRSTKAAKGAYCGRPA